jgi:hypothetical protein
LLHGGGSRVESFYFWNHRDLCPTDPYTPFDAGHCCCKNKLSTLKTPSRNVDIFNQKKSISVHNVCVNAYRRKKLVRQSIYTRTHARLDIYIYVI